MVFSSLEMQGRLIKTKVSYRLFYCLKRNVSQTFNSSIYKKVFPTGLCHSYYLLRWMTMISTTVMVFIYVRVELSRHVQFNLLVKIALFSHSKLLLRQGFLVELDCNCWSDCLLICWVINSDLVCVFRLYFCSPNSGILWGSLITI